MVTRSGDGALRASFTAAIPRSGEWELQVHLPSKIGFRGAKTWGTWDLIVRDASGDRTIGFDADEADHSWNTVGTMELMDGEVTVDLSDKTDGKIVVADAIRWIPADADEAEEPQSVE